MGAQNGPVDREWNYRCMERSCQQRMRLQVHGTVMQTENGIIGAWNGHANSEQMHGTDVLTENGIMDAWNGPVNRNELWVHEIVKSVGE